MYQIPSYPMTFTRRDPAMGFTFPVKVIKQNDNGTVEGILDIDNMSTTQKILAKFL